MKDSFLVTIVAIVTVVCGAILWQRTSYLENPTNSDWWSIAFISTNAADASFSLENFGNSRLFSFNISIDGSNVRSGSNEIAAGGEKIIPAQNPEGKPVRITVWIDGKENASSKDWSKRKEIYKR